MRISFFDYNLHINDCGLIRKPVICICKNKDADKLWVTAPLISTFVFATLLVQCHIFLNPKFQVFATLIVQSLIFLNLTFQASNHLLWQHRPVCVRPGGNSRRLVFLHRSSYVFVKASLATISSASVGQKSCSMYQW